MECAVVHASGNSTVEAASLSGCTIYLSDRAQDVGHTAKARIVQN